jgi:hypothetical protein
MKKAYLVSFQPCTRVIAETQDQAIELAIQKIRLNPHPYISWENHFTTEEDTEMPFDPELEIESDPDQPILPGLPEKKLTLLETFEKLHKVLGPHLPDDDSPQETEAFCHPELKADFGAGVFDLDSRYGVRIDRTSSNPDVWTLIIDDDVEDKSYTYDDPNLIGTDYLVFKERFLHVQ